MRREYFYYALVAAALLIAGNQVYTAYLASRPCVEPVAFAVGTIDPRFELSSAALVKNAEAAAAIWNKAAGKTVLTYSAEASLKINLVYDEREALAKLGAEISRQQALEESVRATLHAEQARFTSLQTAYNEKVEAVNARGGATKAEAAELERERNELTALAATINARVATYNARVATRNATIAEYNRSAGRTYEEGQYVRDTAGERVNIFVYLDSAQLTRVLAHEFGHAIGLEHNDNEDSIMYAKNESGNLKPSATDLGDLKELCKL